MAIIRHKFEYINGSFEKKVKIAEEIPCNCLSNCSHRFNYNQLLHAEYCGRKFVDCPSSWKKVSLSSLLDGYEKKENRMANNSNLQLNNWPAISVHDQATFILGNQELINLYRKEKTVKQEKVIKIGNQANIKAPIIIADIIENSFNTLLESKIDNQIKTLLEQLIKEVNEVNKKVSDVNSDEAKTMVRDAETLVKEVTSSKPRKQWFAVTLDSIKQAAITIGEVAKPILDIVNTLKLILVT